MSPNELILSGLFQIFLLVFLLSGLMMQEKPSPAAATPTYCIESHPDYDREKCENENPLHRWRRLQEERVQRQLAWIDSGCECPSAAENETEEDKTLRLECEKACAVKNGCDPKSISYRKGWCITQLIMNAQPFEYEEDMTERTCNSCGEAPPEGVEEDPLDKWRRLQCERVCAKTGKAD